MLSNISQSCHKLITWIALLLPIAIDMKQTDYSVPTWFPNQTFQQSIFGEKKMEESLGLGKKSSGAETDTETLYHGFGYRYRNQVSVVHSIHYTVDIYR